LIRITWLMIAAFSAIAMTSAAKSEPVQSPVCYYKSETYSEGAYLYPNRLVLLNCTVEAGRPQWKVVPTSKLNDLRTQGSNLASATSPEPTSTQVNNPPKATPSERGQKCFAVNGKRYCE
jgi:hypothetical protein